MIFWIRFIHIIVDTRNLKNALPNSVYLK